MRPGIWGCRKTEGGKMISTYRLIGKAKMQSDHVSEMPSAEQKRYIIRQYCTEDSSFMYCVRGDDNPHYGRIVIMNLDTLNKQVSLTAGPQISEGVCADKLIFKNFAPKDSNIYAAHTSSKSILGFSLMHYIQNNRKKIRWSEPAKVEGCISYLKHILEEFFDSPAKEPRPIYSLLQIEKEIGTTNPEDEQDQMDFLDNLVAKESSDQEYQSRFEKQLNDIGGKNQAYAITIDGRFMHEIEEVSECYLDVLYYHMIDKQFADSKNQGACHLCSEQAKLSNKVNLMQKFYGVSNPYYFDSASNSNSRCAFSMCRTCYNEVTVGMKYAGSAYTTYLIGLSCIILPDFEFTLREDDQLIDPLSLKNIPKLLSSKKKTQMAANLEIVQKLQTRLRGFSLLFHQRESATSQEFVVYQYIKGVNLSSLVKKTEHLVELSLAHGLPELFNSNYGLSFESLRLLLLPSKDSHPRLKPKYESKPPDYQALNRDILALLSTYLYSRSFDYSELIKQFVDIHARRRHHVGDQSTYDLDLSPFVMMLYLKHLLNFKQLRGLILKEERRMTTSLEKPQIVEYFNNNAAVYEGNINAQGLFLLGWYIAEVEKKQSDKQRDKPIKRTVIHRLNLRGIPVQKVKTIMAVIDDMRVIWNVYYDMSTDAYYRECLNDIEHSRFSPEEVIYHILCGRSYNYYLGMVYKKQQANKDSQEAQND